MYIVLYKNIVKRNLIPFFTILIPNKNRKSLINILSGNLNGHYFDESIIEVLNEKTSIKKYITKA